MKGQRRVLMKQWLTVVAVLVVVAVAGASQAPGTGG